jgi:hypothetical protein
MNQREKDLVEKILGQLNLSYKLKEHSYYLPHFEISIHASGVKLDDIYLNIPSDLKGFVFQIILPSNRLNNKIAENILNNILPDLLSHNYVTKEKCMKVGGSKNAGYFSIYLCDNRTKFQEQEIVEIISTRMKLIYEKLLIPKII